MERLMPQLAYRRTRDGYYQLLRDGKDAGTLTKNDNGTFSYVQTGTTRKTMRDLIVAVANEMADAADEIAPTPEKGIELRHEAPSERDDRHAFYLPKTGDFKTDLFPAAWAKHVTDGIEVWSNGGVAGVPRKAFFVRGDIYAAKKHVEALIDAVTPEEKAWHRLDELACELSPENLCCDGELRGRALQTKHRALLKAWAEQEKILGRKVTESDVWSRVKASI